jgi:hypothetical protein
MTIRARASEGGAIMKLDKNRVLELLAEADTKWFKSHSGQFSYREHLDHTSDYVVKNYNRRP